MDWKKVFWGMVAAALLAPVIMYGSRMWGSIPEIIERGGPYDLLTYLIAYPLVAIAGAYQIAKKKIFVKNKN